jgi:MFS family permease
VVPIPIPVIRDVISIGDVLLALGIFWAIVYSMTRPNAPIRSAVRLSPRPADPFAGMPSSPPQPPQAAVAAALAGEATVEAAAPARAQSPYLALVRNRNFSLLWIGQFLSFVGDRIHQVAVGFLVLQVGTPLDVGLTFGATALPNVFLGPLAGVFVDRWDRRTTMIACDIVRAILVLLVPLVINIHIGLVYLISFLVATVGLLFRPAKTAILPRIVDEEQLVTANSATSVAETVADLGYPVAAAIVTALSGLIAAAFILDSATYVVSALLIWAMVVPRDTSGPAEPPSVRVVWREMAEGLRFLVEQKELLANTLISTVALLAFGAEIVTSLIYAERVLDQSVLEYPTNYGWLQGSLGLGSVFGGLLLGAVAIRAPKGLLTIAGFVGLGAGLIAAGMVTNPYVAIAIFFGIGVANMLYLVPTITLFQQRTPQRLFGRVVSTRQALTFGAMALSMGVSGWLAGVIGPERVLIGGGVMIAAAGLAGLTVPAMRNAR